MNFLKFESGDRLLIYTEIPKFSLHRLGEALPSLSKNLPTVMMIRRSLPDIPMCWGAAVEECSTLLLESTHMFRNPCGLYSPILSARRRWMGSPNGTATVDVYTVQEVSSHDLICLPVNSNNVGVVIDTLGDVQVAISCRWSCRSHAASVHYT